MGNLFKPYVGLRPFWADESLIFFGREKQTLELLQRLHQNKFVAVVGTSGCGKSSLIRAGLIPALKGGYLVEDSDVWCIAKMKPGGKPIYNLAESINEQVQELNPEVSTISNDDLVKKIEDDGVDAILELIKPLRKSKHVNFFLLVDQFEELFDFAKKEPQSERKNEAAGFVNLMLDLAEQTEIPFYVVMTMRSDFIGDCTEYFRLPEALNQSQYLVPRLTRTQLKQVIEGPANLSNLKFDSALTSKLLNETTRAQDQLPVLQHALLRMWKNEVSKNKDGIIDFKDYDAIGGLNNALSQDANEAYKSLKNPKDKEIAEKIFKALTSIDASGRKIRKRIELENLIIVCNTTRADIDRIINVFVDNDRSFIIYYPEKGLDQIIDISHESLIRQWDTLGSWVDEEDESASHYLQLAEARRLNKLKKKDFLTGSELQLAIDWRDKFKPTPVWANRYKEGFKDCMDYLQASEDERTRLEEIDARKSQRLKRWSIASMALMGVLVIVGIGYVYNQNEANKEEAARIEKERNQKQAFEKFMFAYDVLEIDPTSSLELQLEAIKLYEDFPQFRSVAKKTYQNYSRYEKLSIPSQDKNHPITIAPNGDKILLGGVTRNYLKFWNPKTSVSNDDANQETIIELPSMAYEVLVSPDGTKILTSFLSGVPILWDRDGNKIIELGDKGQNILAIDFSPDGQTIATGANDGGGQTFIWDATGKLKNVFNDHSGRIIAVAFTSDGKNLISAGHDNYVKKRNLISGEVTTIFQSPGDMSSISLAPDDKSILVAAYDFSVRITTDGKAESLMSYIDLDSTGQSSYIMSLAYSPNMDFIAHGYKDGRIILFDIENDSTPRTFRDHPEGVFKIRFSEDGEKILAGSILGPPSIYHIKDNTKDTLDIKNTFVSGLNYKGEEIVLAITDNISLLLDNKGEVIREISNVPDKTFKTAFSSNGNYILTGGGGFEKGLIKLLNIDGTIIKSFSGHKKEISSVAFSPTDSTMFATGSYDQSAIIWSTERDGVIKQFKGHKKAVNVVVFSPDGRKLLTGSDDNTAIIRDVNIQGNEITLNGHKGAISCAAFLQNGIVVTGSSDATIKIWDINKPEKEMEIKEMRGHQSEITCMVISPDGESLLTASRDGNAILWDRGEIAQVFSGHNGAIISLAFIENGTKVLTSAEDGTVRSWDIKNKSKPESIFYNPKNAYNVSTVSFIDNDQKIMAISQYDGAYGIFERDGLPEFEYSIFELLEEASFQNLREEIDDVYLSDDGTLALIEYMDSPSQIWDLSNKSLVDNIPNVEFDIALARFSRDNSKVFMANYSGDTFWFNRDDLASGINVTVGGHSDEVAGIVFSPINNFEVLTYSYDGVVIKWDLNSGDKINYRGLDSPVTSAAFSKDGEEILAGSYHGSVILWKRDQTFLQSYPAEIYGSITALAFSHDGKSIITGSSGGATLLWSKNGGEVIQLFEHPETILSVDFSEDDQEIVTSCYDGLIRRWKIKTEPTFSDFLKSKNINPISTSLNESEESEDN